MSVRVSNVSAMRALPTTSFSSNLANTVFVETVGDFFRFVPQSALAAVSNFILASSDGLGQWFRMGIQNQTFLAANFWAIDPVGGNDENAGWGATQAAADLVPLQTMAELNRRLSGARYGRTVVFHQLSSISETGWTPLTNVAADLNGYPVWLGRKATFFSGPVTTYVAAVPASNTGVQLSMASVPASWTASSLIGKMVESADGARVAWAQKDLTAKTARLTQPTTIDVTSRANPSASSFSAAEIVNVITVPDLPSFPFGPQCAYAGIQDVNLSGQSTDADMGASQTFMGRVGVGAISLRGIQSLSYNTLAGCCLKTSFLTLTGASFAMTHSGALGSAVFVQGNAAFNVNHAGFDMQASRVVISSGGYVNAFGSDSLIGAFDCTGVVLSVSDDAQPGRSIRMNASTKVYGSGNTNAIVSIPAGVSATLPAAANCTVTTSAAHPLSVAGTAKDFADVPYADATKLAGVNNG